MNDINISRKKRKSFEAEFQNKEITFCDTKRFSRYKINDINNSNLSKNLSLNKNSEDYYDSPVYNKLINKDKIFFGNNCFEKKHYLIKSSSELFHQNKKLFSNSKIIRDFYNKRLKMNVNLNLSFEYKNNNLILDDEKLLIHNSQNDNNLRKIIHLFSLVNIKIQNKIQKSKKDKDLNLYSNNLNINYKNIPSKFSRKNKNKNKFITNSINKIYPSHLKNKSELYNFSESGLLKNKILKLNKYNISNISNQENKNNNNNHHQKKINFNNYDSFIMSSDFNDIFERGRKLQIKGSNKYRSMRKININLNDSGRDKNTLLNKSKIKNHSINYSNPRKIKNETRIKTIINEYMNREKNKIGNIIYKSKKKDDFETQKIIKKRIILEEEYMINSEGDQKLLSIRKLEDENNNEENSNNSLSVRNIKEKIINKENSSNKKNKLNKDNSRRTTHNNRAGIKSIDDYNQIKNILKNHKIRKTSNKKSKDLKINQTLINNKLNRIKKFENKLPIKNNSSTKPNIEKKLIKESKNKERSLNKKLFYNRIYINKFNKSSNRSKINFHQNYINCNQTSINYLDDKEKSKLDISKGIYNNISFSKNQPYMIYHNDEKNQNFYINNNQNCANMVNIVFLNNEKNKNSKISERPKAVCDLKKNNYKFIDIKSTFNDENSSGIKSTRNQHNKNITNVTSFDVPSPKDKNNNYSIYSSIDNMNDKRIKNLSILEYLSSKPKPRINDVNSKYINKSSLNKKDFPKYFFD